MARACAGARLTPALQLGLRWPVVPRSPAPNATAADGDATLDPVTAASVGVVRRAMTAAGLTAHYVMDVCMAVGSETLFFARCNLRSVQTCERWHMRLQDGIVVATGYAGSVMFLLSAVRLSLVTNMLIAVGLFSLSSAAVMYLCYGYSPRCVPLVPTCFVRDLYTTVEAFFPRQLRVPYALLHTNMHSALLRETCTLWLTPDCLARCVDVPFLYRDWRAVLAWTVAELDSDALELELQSLAALAPLGIADGLTPLMEMKRNVYRLGDPSTISANRICAVLRGYTAVPALILAAMTVLLALQASNLVFTLVYSALALVASVLVSVFTV